MAARFSARSSRFTDGSLLGACILVVLGAGAIEDGYGRFDYAGDAISYLDMAAAMERGDWALACNSYWSPGYPLLVASLRWTFPAGAEGEYLAVHLLNLLVFLAVYAAFVWLLREIFRFAARTEKEPVSTWGRRLALVITSGVFLLWQLLVGNVSRTSPDLLISGVFFAVTALALRFLERPSAPRALLLGAVMGLGYVAKAVFLPISGIVMVMLVVELIGSGRLTVGRTGVSLAFIALAFALVALPCVVADSRADGHFSLGDTGPLNYAWSVDGLPHWLHWEGGPGISGAPIHPGRLVMQNPPLFAFPTPFAVTYPPWFAPAYWYAGYHPVVRLHSQLAATRSNLGDIAGYFVAGGHHAIKLAFLALLAPLALALVKERGLWLRRMGAFSPFWLPALLGFTLYALIVVNERYVVAFLILLTVLPVLALLVPRPLVMEKTARRLTALALLIILTVLGLQKQDMWERALHHESHRADEPWRVAEFLRAQGIRPGEAVGSVQPGGAMLCTWAHAAGVHIVAEIGNDSYDPASQAADCHQFVHEPTVQRKALNLFRQIGAVAVVVTAVGEPVAGPGWEQVPGTTSWVYRFR